jgi:hypothetical protein
MAILLSLLVFITFILPDKCLCAEDWQSIDRENEAKVLQVNVGLKLKLQNVYWLKVADISTKKNYYIFTNGAKDRGFQIVGRGSAFPITTDAKEITYFVTNKHVLDNAKQMEEECEMFCAAAMFYAKNQMSGNNTFQRLLGIINLGNKTDRTFAETKLYQDTVNQIWDCYDNKLSKRVDPNRRLFAKYKRLASVVSQAGYFLHIAGSYDQPIEARVYKLSKSDNPDLAILSAVISNRTRNRLPIINGMAVDYKIMPNEEIHLLGYPVVDNFEDKTIFHPTISAGKVTKINAHSIDFEADINKGDSGGPVINKNGKAIAVITNRVVSQQGFILSSRGSAIKMEDVKQFAPELFDTNTKSSVRVR